MGLIGLLVGGAIDAHKAIKQNQAQKNEEVHHVVVEDKFSIDVPSFLSDIHDAGEDASVHYGSRTLGVTFQIIDEPKDEFVEVIADLKADLPSLCENESLLDKMAVLVLSNLFEDMDKVEIGNYKETQINGLKAVTLNAFQKRTFFKDAMYGTFAFVEGENMLYQIIILSGGTSITKLADKLELSINSFREL